MNFFCRGLLLFCCFILFLITTIVFSMIFIPSIGEGFSDFERNLPKYTDKIEYIDGGFGDFTEYKEFFYEKNVVSEFDNNKYFKKVDENDIATINGYFEHFEKSLQFFQHKENYEFHKSQIKENDYFYIESKESYIYDVYYVDMEKCIMYYIHSNI